ncbi:CoA transferase [Serinicoccus sp. LYQ131]|uniref:CoA transferase n=1 Tax=Serinicoccus sp. LYQ131 TaxID=3378797 RepID=UPI003851F05C
MSLPRLAEWLGPAVGTVDDGPDAVDGPRRWWAGPLDVEGLALGSVRAAVSAFRLLTGERGLAVSAAQVAGAFGSQEYLRVDGRTPQMFAPLSRWFRAADGWVRLHGNYPHHVLALREVYGVSEPEELVRILRDRTAAEIESAVDAAGGIAAGLRTPGDWLSSPAGQAVAAEPWISWRFGASGSSPPVGPGLSGVRVLDLTRVIAGPTGTRLLAQLGADVLRVDPPHRPEILAQHLDTGAGKRSVVADLGDPGTRSRVEDLLGAADVVVTGYRPGALDRWGLGEEALRERHPHLVVVVLDAYGRQGPWAGRRGFDSIVQAATGIGHVYGGEVGGSWRPGALPVQALDHATGYGMAAAAMALLLRRTRDGAGSAHLSLARTAHVLLQLPPVSGATRQLSVTTQQTHSPHGLLDHAVGPITRDGVPVPLGVPGRYGAADLSW